MVFVAATGPPKNTSERSSSEAHSQGVSVISVPSFQDDDGVTRGLRQVKGRRVGVLQGSCNDCELDSWSSDQGNERSECFVVLRNSDRLVSRDWRCREIEVVGSNENQRKRAPHRSRI